jgi:hypothetical protein
MYRGSLKLSVAVILVLFLSLISTFSYGQNGWPIEPIDQGHPIGNSFGEFQDDGGCVRDGFPEPSCAYQHAGIDILGTPRWSDSQCQIEDPSAPWVRATAGGNAEVHYIENDFNAYNDISIEDTNGVIYRYGHIEWRSLLATIDIDANNEAIVQGGSPMAQLARWPSCDYHHLHYEIEKDGEFMNPLKSIIPHPDTDPPEITAVSFVRNNSDEQLKQLDPTGCIVVSGEIDIIAQVSDRDRAGWDHPGTSTLWVHHVRWRACPESNPNCSWNDTYSFDTMPTEWHDTKNNAATLAYFSVTDPWQSSSDYCQRTDLYAIVTNSKSDANGMPRPDQAGNWDTRTVPDGNYFVSVEAKDFAGNTNLPMIPICVHVNNGASSNGVSPSSPKGLRIP